MGLRFRRKESTRAINLRVSFRMKYPITIMMIMGIIIEKTPIILSLLSVIFLSRINWLFESGSYWFKEEEYVWTEISSVKVENLMILNHPFPPLGLS